MDMLSEPATRIAAILKQRRQSVCVAESSTGGLVSAALLAVPGASAYFKGGAVIYTRQSRRALLGIADEAMDGLRPSSEAYAALLAATMRERHEADWGLGESGAAGPAGNSYGDQPGHSCLAVSGRIARATTLETGSPDRAGNMRAFAAGLLDLFIAVLGDAEA